MITKESEMINEAIGYIVTEYKKCADQEDDEETRSQYMDLVHAMSVSEENPITIRYYLVNSGEYKQHRISNGTVKDDKKFYADVPMPKSSNATASAFGWEFQSNAAIMLMLKNIESASKVKS